jgi:DNA-binding NarL/FixJ family response regulator
VIDDSPLALAVIQETLEPSGYRVRTLESAFGLIKLLRTHPPALILLDVGLASMNGTKLVGLVRQHVPSQTRIVLYSGRDDESLARDVSECGANGFIHKRTTGAALVRAVSKFLI